jgi:hypothetical protein
VERGHRRLEREAHHRERDAAEQQRVVGGRALDRRRDPREVRRAGRAVQERQAEEQRRGSDGADDEVLQPRLQRALAARLGGAQHVERDRQQLEPEEERDEVLRRDEHEHARRRAEQQAVELAVRGLAGRDVPPGQQRRRDAGDAEEQVEGERELVEAQRPLHEVGPLAPLPDRQADGRREGADGEQRHGALADPARAPQPDDEHDQRAAEEGDERRQAGPVDERLLNQGAVVSRAAASPPAMAFAAATAPFVLSSLRCSATCG